MTAESIDDNRRERETQTWGKRLPLTSQSQTAATKGTKRHEKVFVSLRASLWLPVGLNLSLRRFAAIVGAMFRTQDLHVREIARLLAPGKLKAELPITEAASTTVARCRDAVTRILRQQDSRLLVVVG